MTTVDVFISEQLPTCVIGWSRGQILCHKSEKSQEPISDLIRPTHNRFEN